MGEDQREHLELMRDVARRFNARFGAGEEVLVVPEHRIPEVGARVMDLQDPAVKMSTTGGSEAGTVYVLDEPTVIAKKLKGAVTDSGSEVRRAPEKPGVSNLIEILAAVRGVDPTAVESELLRRALWRLQDRGGERGCRTTWRRCASATSGCAPTTARSRRSSTTARGAPARWPRRRSATCASAWVSVAPVRTGRYGDAMRPEQMSLGDQTRAPVRA